MSTLNEQISDMEGLQPISLSATSFDMGATDVERTRVCAAPRRPVPTCAYRLGPRTWLSRLAGNLEKAKITGDKGTLVALACTMDHSLGRGWMKQRSARNKGENRTFKCGFPWHLRSSEMLHSAHWYLEVAETSVPCVTGKNSRGGSLQSREVLLVSAMKAYRATH